MRNQEQARNLVEREIYCCVSSLMSGVMQIAYNIPYKEFTNAFGTNQDELMDLFQRPDYEEAARAFIMDDADLDQLKEIAENNGYWEDVLSASKVPEVSEDEDGCFRLPDSTELFDDEYDAECEAIESVLPEIRKQVWAIVNTGDAYQKICNDYDLEYDYCEVYEHWVVSSWLAKRLHERDEVVEDFAGLTIWGRCCSGQSICMDSVIQNIAEEL